MTKKLMMSDLLYDADIVICENITGKTHYFDAKLAPSVENQDGVVVTIVLEKGEELTLKQVMKGER